MKGRALLVIPTFLMLVAWDWNGGGASWSFGANSSGPAQALAQKPSYDSLRDGFRNPPPEYGQINCWWWEAGRLNKEKMRWELEDLKDKGGAGTWLYSRCVWGEPLSSDPGYWADAWWGLIRFTMQQNQRLGLLSWYANWTTHQFIQRKIRSELKTTSALSGRSLAIHEQKLNGPGALEINIPDDEEILSAAAFKKSGDGLDYASRKGFQATITGHKLTWSAPAPGWVATVVVSQPHDLDYLNKSVVDKRVQLLAGSCAQHIPGYMGKQLVAYGPDEMWLIQGTAEVSDPRNSHATKSAVGP